jgi:dual specificity tyrosine-phosphorylation-regulated kinase 2/3/4
MQISKFLLHTNNNSDDQNDRNSRNEPGLGLGSGFTPLQSSSFPITREKKTPLSVTRTISLKYSQKYQRQGSEITTDQVRAPKSVTTVLKYYRKYLSEFEKEMEVYEYKHIYFIGNIHKKYGQDINNPQLNYGYDDEKGDYNVTQHDHLGYRYEIIRLVGRGSFGQVVQCLDHKTTQTVAIKLIRNKKRFHAQAITEVDILRRLVEWDPYDQYHTVQMTDYFYFRNHLCIALEYLADNLYEFIKSNHFRGFHLCLVKRFNNNPMHLLVYLFI